ncbi:MAG: translation initiation factor IF-2 N-terminal domain-containing protein, partial [Actinomycetota bacterium]
MARPRVHEVAKELGLSSKEVLAHLEKIGEPVKSHSSSIEE